MFSIWKKRKEQTERHFGIEILVKKDKKFYAYCNRKGIHIEKSAITKLSKNALKTIIMHERFHQRWDEQSSSMWIIPLAVALLAISIVGLIVFAGLAIYFYAILRVHSAISIIIISGLAYFAFSSAIIYFLQLYYSRTCEAAADLYSAKEIGKEKFVSGMEERYAKYPKYGSETTLKDRIWHWDYLFRHRYKKDRLKLVKKT